LGDASIADQGLLWRRYGKPAVHKAGISKRVGWHTFRHSYTTLLKNNGEDIKVVQELLRHANARVTMDVYAQAMMPAKRAAQSKLVRMVLGNGEQETQAAAINGWTFVDVSRKRLFAARA